MDFSWERFRQLPVVGILRGFSPDALRELLPAARAGGLTNIEVTMNSADAVGQIRLLTELAGETMNVGAGTVTNLAQLDAALAAGASYIVTPAVVPAVITACKERGIPVFPGAFTPSEVLQAWELGADLVKLFPANHLGPSYIRDLKAPLSQVRLLATGGVTPESLPAYHAAGAEGFGVGSPLFNAARVAAGDWAWVQQQAERFALAYQEATQAC